ncbi:MAG: enoyl-CoA hydratase/isomerase family protein [Flavobacteriaceae bacterium]|nr:enoyl-CoA hydratase/isomerase family protein [Flavobacteriaceae bacterium]
MGNLLMTEGVHVQTDNAVSTITFAHPKQNCFPQAQLNALTEAINTAATTSGVRVILLQSDLSKVFSAGASFDELLAVKTSEQGKTFFMGFANLINAMRLCPKPIVGRIHGKAIGGGVGIIAACDYAIASEAAQIRLSELAIGIGPFVIAPAVARKIGDTALTALAFQPKKWKSATWALQQGLYAEVHPDNKTTNAAAIHTAEQLAQYAPDAVAALKKTLWDNTDHWKVELPKNAETSGRLLLLPETQKTLQQLKSKS